LSHAWWSSSRSAYSLWRVWFECFSTFELDFFFKKNPEPETNPSKTRMMLEYGLNFEVKTVKWWHARLAFQTGSIDCNSQTNFFFFFKNKTLSLSLSLSFSTAGEEARDDGIWKAGGIGMMGWDARPDLGGFLVGSGFGSGRMDGSGLWTAWFFGRIWVSGWISQTHADVRGFLPDLSRAQSLPVHGLRKWTLGGDCLGGGDADMF
jgi:hypothetical protein